MESQFYCTHCGKRGMDIIRKPGRHKEAGHLKKLWCIYEKAEYNHVEVKPCTHYDKDCFDLEYNYGNFDEYGNRKLKFGEFKQKLIKEGVL